MTDPNGANRLALTDIPAYPDIPSYANINGVLHMWEGDGWKKESMSWKTGSYVASNLSNMPEVVISGKQSLELLSALSINNVYSWPIGTSKHLVMPDENGYIANHTLTIRDSEDSFRQFASMPWLPFKQDELAFDVEIAFQNSFVFQVAGPTSLQVLERLIGSSLRSVAFLGTARVSLPGIPADVEIDFSRIGMSGNLAYELRGPIEYGPEVYDAIYRAGKPFGIVRSGWRTYVVNHTEGGFPQMGCSFLPASYVAPGFLEHPLYGPEVPEWLTPGGALPGSFDPKDIPARLRTPQEVNWGWMAKFDHDFLGREAVQAEAANPRRKTVTLVWNSDDVIDVMASLFQKGEEYKSFEFPTTPQSPAGGHADLVTKGDEPVGISSLAVYSYYYREMISHSTIDLDQAGLGNEVVIHWGDHGGRIKEIRATVSRFPYLDLPSNRDYDLASIPSGVAG
jgi:glycine cleavage system aminomethyltransferase T